MTLYLKLLHGRDDPHQDMEGWGFNGPILGPFLAVHITYRDHIRCIASYAENLTLGFTEDMLTYEDKYYGDFEILAGPADTRRSLPPDPEGMNGDRAEWAARALLHFRRTTGCDRDCSLGDLLCDLMHWSDRANFDFDAALCRARGQYASETARGVM